MMLCYELYFRINQRLASCISVMIAFVLLLYNGYYKSIAGGGRPVQWVREGEWCQCC